uniref:Tetraspanin n=1 Tax=Panagrellus redivivus TaxID=6233 RepID=A0A7E4ULU8_PANRE
MCSKVKRAFETAELLVFQFLEAHKLACFRAFMGFGLAAVCILSDTFFSRQLPDFFYILSPVTDRHVNSADLWSVVFPLCLVLLSLISLLLSCWMDESKLKVGTCTALLLVILIALYSKPYLIVPKTSIDDIRQGLNSTINGTYSDTFRTNFTRDWSTVQQKHQCCGVDNLNDWRYSDATLNDQRNSTCFTDRCCHKNVEGDADGIIKYNNGDEKCYKYGCIAPIVNNFYGFELYYAEQAKRDYIYMAVIMFLAICYACISEGSDDSLDDQHAPDGKDDKKKARVSAPQPVDDQEKPNGKDEKKDGPGGAQPRGNQNPPNQRGGRGGKRGKKNK